MQSIKNIYIPLIFYFYTKILQASQLFIVESGYSGQNNASRKILLYPGLTVYIYIYIYIYK